jgi:hypothetical protein
MLLSSFSVLFGYLLIPSGSQLSSLNCLAIIFMIAMPHYMICGPLDFISEMIISM